MQAQFEKVLSELLKPLQAEGAPILIGVSGGADSMCLVSLVLRAGVPLGIAHCNFQLRSTDSDADEDFVRNWASQNHIPFHSKRFPTEGYARERGISIEMAAREIRYRFFGETAREHGYAAVAVAHHAQDNAETLILNLLRGTGPKGICGMKTSGVLPVPGYADIPLLRPLLGFTREEVRDYVHTEGIPFREDGTNAGNEYKRNKLRNLVFPVFRDINPSFVQTLNRDMERFAEAYREMPSEGRPTGATEGSHSVMSTETGGRAEQSPGTCTLTEEPWDGTQPVKQPVGILIADADRTGPSPTFRTWQAGDWIRPLGAPGRKKLQDWFTDHHIDPAEKRTIPLLQDPADPSHILAIVGHCIDESVKVTPRTRRIWRIELK